MNYIWRLGREKMPLPKVNGHFNTQKKYDWHSIYFKTEGGSSILIFFSKAITSVHNMMANKRLVLQAHCLKENFAMKINWYTYKTILLWYADHNQYHLLIRKKARQRKIWTTETHH